MIIMTDDNDVKSVANPLLSSFVCLVECTRIGLGSFGFLGFLFQACRFSSPGASLASRVARPCTAKWDTGWPRRRSSTMRA